MFELIVITYHKADNIHIINVYIALCDGELQELATLSIIHYFFVHPRI